MHDLISLTKVNGTYCSRGCFRVRLKPVFLLKQRGGKKGGGVQRGQTLNQRRFLFFFFFLSFTSWHEQTCGCTIASVTPSTMCSCAGQACLAPPHPHIPRLSDRPHLGEGCREFHGGIAGKTPPLPEGSEHPQECPVCPEGNLRAANPAKFAQGWVSLHFPVPAKLSWAKGATGFLLAFNSGVVKGEELQKVLMRLSGWAIKWQMKFSVYKQKVVHVGKNNP